MRRWSISDLHLGVGKSNEFGARMKLVEFLNSIPDRSLILNGDIFELLKDDRLEDIVAEWKDLVGLLFQKAVAYVIGNHDRSLLNSSFSPPSFMGAPIMRYLIEGDTLFMHGDQFDPANNDTNHIVGDTVTGMVGWLSENISQEINGWSRELEKLTRDIGRNGDSAHYRNSALDFIEHMVVDWHRLSRVVVGHTHQKDYDKRNDRLEYYNTGCWLQGHEDVLELEIKED